jgi:hypothetical protein
MPHVAACIHHGIGFSSDVVKKRDVSIVPFMEGLQAKQTLWKTAGRGGTFTLPPDGGHIVQRVVNGGLSDIKMLGQHVMLSNTGFQLQFTVVNIDPWVFERY